MADSRKHFCVLAVIIVVHLGIEIGNAKELTSNQYGVNTFNMKQDLKAQTVLHMKKRSLRHLVKRDTGTGGDELCHSQARTFESKRAESEAGHKFATTWKFGNETKYSMALAWAGENNGKILVATTEEVEILGLAAPSTLYQSINGGISFLNITHRIDNSIIRKDNGLQKDPHNPARVFIVAHGQGLHSIMYLTNDGGDMFKKVVLPFLLRDSIIYNPNKTYSDHLLARSIQDKTLYLSKNGGEVWTAIKHNVVHFKWGAPEENAIYATVDPQNSEGTDNTLVRSDDQGTTWQQLLKNTYTFGKEGKFLFATVRRPNTYGERLMEVSTDAGKTWNEAQLPTITEDRFYSILDMTEGLIFMHVDAPRDTGHGTLYTSDSSGIIFSASLQKHLYPNYQELTDFYKVNSMRGVYLASQLESDNSIHTMITFNRGSTWQLIKRPAGVPCKNESKACFLQIHNAYSIANGIAASQPLSVTNAPGLILVHGHVADALQTTPPDIFVSSDGGYSWSKALDGPHYLQIADHGGLLIAVPMTPTPDTIKFSTDEGRCWHSFKFTDTKVMFTGLLTEPGNRAMSIGVWGFGQADKIWSVHTFNFSSIITRQCDKKIDYEDWLAHGDNTNNPKFKGCLLGKVEKFRRLKKDSWCANGYSYEVTKTLKTCECRREDYECDYGYRRPEGSDICSKNPEFQGAPLDVCILGHEEEVITEGYRKVPGDVCSGGFSPQGEKIVNLPKKCKMGSKEIITKEIVPANVSYGPHGNAVLVTIILLVLILAVICIAYFIRKYNILRRATVTYRYSSLNQNEEQDQDNDFENAFTRSSLYEDTSDEELTAKVVNYSSLAKELDPAGSGGSRPKGTVPYGTSTRGSGRNPVQPHLKSYHDDSDVDLLE